MPFIWKDKTYWKRYKKSAKIELKLLMPLVLINFSIIYYFPENSIPIKDMVIVSFSSALTIFTFINIFKQYPNSEIPDTYSKTAKNLMYLFQFIMSFCLFLFLINIYIIPIPN